MPRLASDVEPYIGLVVLALSIPAFVLFERRHRRTSAVMAEVARRRNGKLVPRYRKIDQVQIAAGPISMTVAGDGAPFGVLLRWTAELPPPGTVPFRITAAIPERVEKGGPPGEIEARDREGFLRVWRTEEEELMRRFFRHGELTSTGRKLTLAASMRRLDVETVDAGITLLLRVANADVYGLAALRTLADAREISSPDGLPRVVIDGPVPVWIGVERIDGRAQTRASAQGAASKIPGTVELARGRPVEVEAASRLPKAAIPRLRALGSATISWDAEKTWIHWDGIHDDPKDLAAAVAFLRAMTAPPSMGIFR